MLLGIALEGGRSAASRLLDQGWLYRCFCSREEIEARRLALLDPVLASLADLSRPETREWVKSYMRRALDVGFTGWMADFGEWLPHDAVLASGAEIE